MLFSINPKYNSRMLIYYFLITMSPMCSGAPTNKNNQDNRLINLVPPLTAGIGATAAAHRLLQGSDPRKSKQEMMMKYKNEANQSIKKEIKEISAQAQQDGTITGQGTTGSYLSLLGRLNNVIHEISDINTDPQDMTWEHMQSLLYVLCVSMIKGGICKKKEQQVPLNSQENKEIQLIRSCVKHIFLMLCEYIPPKADLERTFKIGHIEGCNDASPMVYIIMDFIEQGDYEILNHIKNSSVALYLITEMKRIMDKTPMKHKNLNDVMAEYLESKERTGDKYQSRNMMNYFSIANLYVNPNTRETQDVMKSKNTMKHIEILETCIRLCSACKKTAEAVKTPTEPPIIVICNSYKELIKEYNAYPNEEIFQRLIDLFIEISQEFFINLKSENLSQLRFTLESENLIWAFFHRLYTEPEKKSNIFLISKKQDDFADRIPDRNLKMFFKSMFVKFAKTAKN